MNLKRNQAASESSKWRLYTKLSARLCSQTRKMPGTRTWAQAPTKLSSRPASSTTGKKTQVSQCRHLVVHQRFVSVLSRAPFQTQTGRTGKANDDIRRSVEVQGIDLTQSAQKTSQITNRPIQNYPAQAALQAGFTPGNPPHFREVFKCLCHHHRLLRL